MNIIIFTSNSLRSEMKEAEAKDASWTSAEAMMEYFIAGRQVGRRTEGRVCFLFLFVCSIYRTEEVMKIE